MTEPYYADDRVTLLHGSCLDVLADLPDASVDAVVCDPPYGLANTTPEKIAETVTRWVNGERDYLPTGKGFMGNPWDAFVPPVAVWDDCLRVLKPGGHVLAFAGSRTMDLMTLSLRLAGFDIRDSIAWLYGSGFPKSLDVSKAIDKLDATQVRRDRALRFAAWMRQHLTAAQIDAATGTNMGSHYVTDKSQPAVATADLFDRLRPLLPTVPEWVEQMVEQRTVESRNFKAREVLATERRTNEPSGIVGIGQGERVMFDRKITAPATDDARTWQGWGTALKPAFEPVVVARKPFAGTVAGNVLEHGTGALNIDGCRVGDGEDRVSGGGGGMSGASPVAMGTGWHAGRIERPTGGRWPANVVLDESQAEALDEQSGTLQSGANPTRRGSDKFRDTYGDFAGQQECIAHRGADSGGASRFFYVAKASKRERPNVDGVAHPTVKPLALMRWLVRLVTPPGGTVLEPFAGSGTTIEAALLEGFNVIGIEREAEYLPLIEARIARALAADTDLFGGAA